MAEERITTADAALANWKQFEAQLSQSAAAMGVTSEAQRIKPTDDLPPFDRKVVLNLALVGLGFVAVALGAHYLAAHQAAVEAAKAVQHTGGIIFQCVKPGTGFSEHAADTWQLVTQTVGKGINETMQTAAQSMVDLRHGFANAAGTIFQRGVGQTSFHQVYDYIPQGSAYSLSGVIGTPCPAQMIPLP